MDEDFPGFKEFHRLQEEQNNIRQKFTTGRYPV